MDKNFNLFREVKKCLFCKSEDLIDVFSFGNFPVCCGVTSDKSHYKLYPFDILVCKKCGLVQQRNLINPEILYADFKNEGFGPTWGKHYKLLYEFIVREAKNGRKILEIGAGGGKTIDYFPEDFDITLCEPNLKPRSFSKNIKVEKVFFEEYKTKKKFDIVFLSHVFEHLLNPIFFLEKAKNLLRRNGKIIISLPNFKYRFMNIDAFSQEHTIYPTDEILTNFLINQGFEIINKEFYLNHSIFYSIRPLIKKKNVVLPSLFKQSKKLISEYSKQLNKLCRFYKNNLQNRAYYIFSAHIFAQILLFCCGLPINKCLGFLDNAKVKHNGYLYGTNLKCYPPSKIKNDKDPVVIASAFTYSKEISKQLKGINKKVEIL